MKRVLTIAFLVVVSVAGLSAAEPSQISTVTIASGEALSGVIDMSERNILGIIMPGTWTAASVGFKASDTLDGTYVPIHRESDGGSRFVVSAAASQMILLNPGDLIGVRFLKVESVTSAGVASNQAGARIIKIIYRKIIQ